MPARASVHIYRYDLPTPSCLEDQFRGELSPASAPSGASPNMSGLDFFRSGKPDGSMRCMRDSTGTLLRVENRTVAGALDEYELFSPVYAPGRDREVWTGYDARGKRMRAETDYFTSTGVLTGYSSHYAGDQVDHYTAYDPDTGLATARKQFNAATHHLEQTETYAYDANGDRLRADVVDAHGAFHGTVEYSAGLETRGRYTNRNGVTETYVYDYNRNHDLANVGLSINGRLVCRLVYDLGPGGIVVKTEARGADGSLWAEYPGRRVERIARDGRDPANGTATLYRHGNWW
jgi:hypothetical protein